MGGLAGAHRILLQARRSMLGQKRIRIKFNALCGRRRMMRCLLLIGGRSAGERVGCVLGPPSPPHRHVVVVGGGKGWLRLSHYVIVVGQLWGCALLCRSRDFCM